MKLTLRRFVGIDLETTGTRIDQGARVIQIGLAVWPPDGSAPETFSSLVSIPLSAPWDKDAAKIHGISRASVADLADHSPDEVARRARRFLKAQFGRIRDGHLRAVGFQVGSFDMKFLERFMPDLAAIFDYHTVDLSAIITHLALASGRKEKTIKAAAKDWAWAQIDGRAHDAGADAQMHLYVFRYLQEHAEEFSVSPREWKARQRNSVSP